MKKFLVFTVLLLTIALAVCAFVACNDKNGGDATDTVPEGEDATGTVPEGEDAPGGEDILDESAVMEAYIARLSADMATGAAASEEHWFAAAYGMNVSDPEWLSEQFGGDYDPSHGIMAWGVVGTHDDKDIGDGLHAEYVWSDSSVFWVRYESAEMAQEKGLSSFGMGVTYRTCFPSAGAFNGFVYKTVGSYVVAARIEKTLDDFFAADTAQNDEVIADTVQWLDMISQPCAVFLVASAAEGYFEISAAMEYNPDHLTGGKQIDCRFYNDAEELVAAVEEYRLKYEDDDSIDVYARGSWLVIDDKG